MGVRSSHDTVDNLLWWWFRPITGTHQEGNPRPRSGPSDLVTAVLPVSSTLPNPYCRYAGSTTSALLSPNNSILLISACFLKKFLVLPGVRNFERLRTTGIDQCISTKGPRTPWEFILRLMAGCPRSPKIGHRGSAGEKG